MEKVAKVPGKNVRDQIILLRKVKLSKPYIMARLKVFKREVQGTVKHFVETGLVDQK